MLASHCRGLAEDHGWTLPADTVPAMAGYLLGRRGATLDLLLAQLDADDFAAGIDAVHRQAFRLLHPTGRRHIPVAPCGAGLWCDVATRVTVVCPGALVVTCRSDDDGQRMSDAVCDECGREVPPVQWRRLADRDVRVTLPELSIWWGIPTRTLQRWAGDDTWISDAGRPARYSVADAERTLARLRGEVQPGLSDTSNTPEDGVELAQVTGCGA
jgi:hypothetical protein